MIDKAYLDDLQALARPDAETGPPCTAEPLPCYFPYPLVISRQDMTNYHLTPPSTLPSLAVQERKAARRKVIEKARKLERDSYKAMIRRRRRLQVKDLFTAEL